MADIYTLVDEQRSFLQSLDRVTAGQMHAAYARVHAQATKDYRGFTARLETWQASHPSMDPRGASPPRHWVFQQQRYKDLMTQLEQNLAYYAKVSTLTIEEAQRAAMGKAQADTTEVIRASLGGGEEAAGAISLAVLPDQAIEAVVGFTSDGTPLNQLLRERSNRTWQDAGATLVNGIALGHGAQEVANRLDTQLTTLHWQNLRLARTEMMRAYREAQRVNMLQNSEVIAGWRWSSAADKRSCPICLGQHGKVFPLKMVPPADVPPDVAHHKGLSDILSKAPHTHARIPDDLDVEFVPEVTPSRRFRPD